MGIPTTKKSSSTKNCKSQMYLIIININVSMTLDVATVTENQHRQTISKIV